MASDTAGWALGMYQSLRAFSAPCNLVALMDSDDSVQTTGYIFKRMIMPLKDRITLREAVAATLRSELARNRISASRVALAIGKDQPWISRRLTGQVAFDLDDLDAITEVLGISPSELMDAASETARKPRRRIREKAVDVVPPDPNTTP